MPSCSTLPGMPDRADGAIITNPDEPHVCQKPADRFAVDRYPSERWFNGTFWYNGVLLGAHRAILPQDWEQWDGNWFAMFRDPYSLAVSAYFRMLDYLRQRVEHKSNQREERRALECMSALGLPRDLDLLYRDRGRSAFDLGVPSHLLALARYAQARGRGAVTRMMTGVACPSCTPYHECRAAPETLDGTVWPETLEFTPPGAPTDEAGALALAIERLDGFRFVGMTDQWDLSICLFHAMIARVPGCTRRGITLPWSLVQTQHLTKRPELRLP